ncbi:802_t:CDS:10 [Diversispora eburnea]|uniref:802_t:CDS:1 n=1 Tax=Diversispora eburnea TaxID=1213867 RepID=A0A9N8VM96_9GLOM|nr:802_t:CDS:10 [Diversispora eburnea]
MNENTPLLASGSNSFGPNDDVYPDRQQRRIFKKPKTYSFVQNLSKRKNNRKINRQQSFVVPINYSAASEQNEVWLKNQKEFIERAVLKPSIKQRIAFKCDTGKRGRIWELFDAILSVTFFMLYIWNTGYVLPDYSPQPFPHSLQTADFVLACLILIQFLPRVWLAKVPYRYAGNYFSILTWISVFPVICAYIQTIYDERMDNTYMGVNNYVFIYPIRFVRAHVAVQVLFIPVKSSLFNFSAIMRKGLKIGTTILFTFLTVAAWIHIISYKQLNIDGNFKYNEYNDKEEINLTLSFYDAFFYTVGAIFLPTHLSELLDLIQQRSKYEHSYKPEKNREHIIVTGNFDASSLFEFLREFFCQDHGMVTMNTHVVILNSDEPDDEISSFLEDPAFVNRVQYVKGSPTFRRSLQKVKADTASAAFLLSSKFSKNNDDEDAAQIMRALALKKFNKKLSLYVQIHLPENVPHFDFLAKDVLCLDEITMGLMAQSLVNPGFASLIVLLTTTITEKIAKRLIHSVKSNRGMNWAIDYIHGAQHEIYAVTFSEAFIGKSFLECSNIIYSHLEAVLFSIGIYDEKMAHYSQSQFQTFLNPQDYIIKGDEIGYVICDNSEIITKMANFNSTTKKWFDSSNFIKKSKSVANLLLTVNKEDEESPRTSSESNRGDEINRTEILNRNIKKAEANCEMPIDSNLQDIKNHILICDHSEVFPENLDIFLMVLREQHSSCHDLPVVILSDSEPSDGRKRLLEKFGAVFFVKGSPLRRKDLYRAKVHLAKKCVILSDASRYERINDGVSDSTSLMIALNVESLAANEECFVLVECIYRETFKMIGESDSVKNNEEEYIQAIMRPSFMSGNVFTPCNLDTMLCQNHEADDKNLSPKIDIQYSERRISSGHMFLVDIPPSFIGKTYHELYYYLIRVHKAIPLGLYRHTIHKESGLNYIYVNPIRDCVIKESDKVYIIAAKTPTFNSEDILEE